MEADEDFFMQLAEVGTFPPAERGGDEAHDSSKRDTRNHAHISVHC